MKYIIDLIDNWSQKLSLKRYHKVVALIADCTTIAALMKLYDFTKVSSVSFPF